MARAHVLLQQAGELVHCDSTASLDKRFRPGVSLRYRELNTLQKNITNLEHIRDTISMVQEEIPCNKSKTIFDYVVDMELGMCSCTRGSTGAACSSGQAL